MIVAHDIDSNFDGTYNTYDSIQLNRIMDWLHLFILP